MSDAPRCAEIIQACVDSMPEFDGPTREFLRAKNTANCFASDAARMSFLVVDVQSEVVVGVGGLDQGEISRLYVDPVYQRRAIGAAVLRALEDEARRKGLSALSVRSSRLARSFYVALGYSELGERVERVGAATFHWIDMVKQLAAHG